MSALLCLGALPAAAQSLLPEPDAGAGAEEAPIEVTPVPDSLLQRRMQAVFRQIDEFEAVEVAVEEGVVRLTGTVLQAEARREAAALAERFEGVLYVDNDLTAETDVETRIAPALERMQAYVDGFVAQLPVIAVALIVLVFFILLSVLVGRWKAPGSWFRVNELVWGLVRRLLRGFLFLAGLLLAFDVLGITSLVGAVLGTAGVVGLAIGFAFQDIVENYLAGLLLSLRRPFGVNDLVRVADYEGRIVRLTSREVVLLTFEGNHVRVPNATVFKNPLTNFTLNPRRLFHFDVGIGTGEDLEEAMRVGVETLRAMRGVLAEPPPFARVQALGESSVVVRFHAWVDQQSVDYLKARSEGLRLVKQGLDEAGVELPEPIYRVLMQQRAEAPPEKPRGPSAAERASSVDVQPDGHLEAQVREDLARSDDENLL